MNSQQNPKPTLEFAPLQVPQALCLLQTKPFEAGLAFHMRERGSSWTQVQGDVRFGSKADICSAKRHVRFTPESGHLRCNKGCPLCAKSGHRAAYSITSSARASSGSGIVKWSAAANMPFHCFAKWRRDCQPIFSVGDRRRAKPSCLFRIEGRRVLAHQVGSAARRALPATGPMQCRLPSVHRRANGR